MRFGACVYFIVCNLLLYHLWSVVKCYLFAASKYQCVE